MKAKTIKSVLRRKIDHWVSSISDPGVREAAKENAFVTGGSIASMLLGEKVNDFDIYFKTQESALAVAEYYVQKFKENPPSRFKPGGEALSISISSGDDRIKIKVKSSGIASEGGSDNYQYFEMNPDPESTDAADYVDQALEVVKDEKKEEGKYRPVFLSSNAITLSDDIQLVFRFYGTPDQVHENYDFVHCTNYWQSWDGKLVLRPAALEALLARELRYVGSRYPLCSFIRTRKFVAKGWTINAGQYLKMAMQLNDLDLNDISVLEDQLTGVDAAYFQQVIDAIKEKDDKVVDRAYLIEVIDRIF